MFTELIYNLWSVYFNTQGYKFNVYYLDSM